MDKEVLKKEKNDEKNLKGLNRRDFIKMGAVGGVGATVAGYTFMKEPLKTIAESNLGISTTDDFPIEITDKYQRMKYQKVMFNNPKYKHLQEEFFPKFFMEVSPSGEVGHTQLDDAFCFAGHSVEFEFEETAIAWNKKPFPEKWKFKNKEEATRIIKKVSKFLGASLVGIAQYDERWTYADYENPETGKWGPMKLPFEPKSVIAFAIEMSYEEFKTAPSLIASASAGKGYSDMACLVHSVASFISKLGYKAFGAMNDTGLSVPIAIQAGLGETSRMGLLVTKEYGPRVRICKVYTELELIPDKPIEFGVVEFCKTCMKCADNCPSKSINKKKNPDFEAVGEYNNPEVKKWYVNAETCFTFWAENGGDCGSCIACCPYNKLPEWHHQLCSIAGKTPARPFLRSMDELFGYGKVNNEKAMTDYWRK